MLHSNQIKLMNNKTTSQDNKQINVLFRAFFKDNFTKLLYGNIYVNLKYIIHDFYTPYSKPNPLINTHTH